MEKKKRKKEINNEILKIRSGHVKTNVAGE